MQQIHCIGKINMDDGLKFEINAEINWHLIIVKLVHVLVTSPATVTALRDDGELVDDDAIQ